MTQWDELDDNDAIRMSFDKIHTRTEIQSSMLNARSWISQNFYALNYKSIAFPSKWVQSQNY